MFVLKPICKCTMNGNYVVNIGRQLGSGGKAGFGRERTLQGVF